MAAVLEKELTEAKPEAAPPQPERVLMLGNAAIARGAWEAGVAFGAGYPGTPSSEIIETLAHFPDVKAQWSTNEKVAFDQCIGVAVAGKRALVAFKHVGLNVAADSFVSFAITGTLGGFVVVAAEDPGMYSSQTEQDNRYYARMAKVPVLEPSDAQEAKDFVKLAFEISEEFQTPVLVRSNMRLGHTKGLVTLEDRVVPPPKPFKPDVARWNVLPVYSRPMRAQLEQKLERIRAYGETSPLNRIEAGGPELAIISSGIAYMHAREAAPHATFLKLGLSYPLPRKLVREFCARFETVYVIEEGEGFIEEQIRALGIQNVVGKERFTNIGELSPELVSQALFGTPIPVSFQAEVAIPPRVPALCSGCPHRGVFFALKRLKAFVAGDIGCYSLASLPPFGNHHTSFCMGASIGTAFGFERAGMDRVVAVIGDSTFFHAGIPPLIDAVYNGAKTTVVVLDNRTTGMTGQEDHAGTGRTLQGETTREVRIEDVCRGIGVEFVKTVNAFQVRDTQNAIKEAMQFPGPAVVVARGACILIPEEKAKAKNPYVIVEDKCTNCGVCYLVGCPSIWEGHTKEDKPFIDPYSCTGCNVCAEICPFDAIVVEDPDQPGDPINTGRVPIGVVGA